MQVLPQVLYVFRTVPIPAPKIFFKHLQSTLSNFLWEGKKARSAFSKLSKIKKAGGVGAPVFLDYHKAAVLAQVKEWFPYQTTPLWGLLEQSQIPGRNLNNFILASAFYNEKIKNASPTVLVTLDYWKKLILSKSLLTPIINLAIPTAVIALLIPNLGLSKWISGGIQWTSDLYINNQLKTFTQLQSEYALPSSEHFNYIRVTSSQK